MKRTLSTQVKQNLINSSLWNNQIKQDCLDQKCFLALRDNIIDIYHKGGRLFEIDKKGIKTHVKYASVLDLNNDYLTEVELMNLKPIASFEAGYKRIKENCSNYSGVEASGIAVIYHNFSYLSSESAIVVLDVEIAFKSDGEGKKMDRVDILLYDTNKQKLQFVEAKHFSNADIWSTTTPKVISQIDRYQRQIEKNQATIINEYTKYVNEINDLFPISLLSPQEISTEVSLLIFGFDKNQRDGRLKELITKNPEYKGIKVYAVGDPKNCSLKELC